MKFFINGESIEFQDDFNVVELWDRLIVKTGSGTYSAVAMREGDAVLVSFKGRQFKLETKLTRSRSTVGFSTGELRAPMPGLIVDVLVSVGEKVAKGQKIAVLEAMKTQQPFFAPFDGILDSVLVVKGQQVDDAQLIGVVKEQK